MANKIITIPVSDIDGLQSTGAYRLRYRIKSKDGIRKSEWSDLATLSYPLNGSGQVSSFYEMYVPPYQRPSLSSTSLDDPHPSNAYAVTDVSYLIGTGYITSTIKSSEDDSGVYTYSWSGVEDYPVAKNFDVYLSWKTSAGTWSNWSLAGTTTSTEFSFKKPVATHQYVQAAVFLSSYPKLTNIFGYLGEITFVSISPAFSTYYDASATVGTPSGTGPYRATITGLTSLPSTSVISGRRVFATADVGNFGTGAVTVVSTSGTSMVVTSPNTLVAGAVVDVRL